MDIKITDLLKEHSMHRYSSSIAEQGVDAGAITWQNAVEACGEGCKLLKTTQEFTAAREHFTGFGAWSDEEINAWSDEEINALLIQLIAGDAREFSDDHVDEWDWDQYELQVAEGVISGRIGRGAGGDIYYYIGE